MKNSQFLRGFLVGAVIVCALILVASIRSGGSLVGSVVGTYESGNDCVARCVDVYDESVYDCNDSDKWDVCIKTTENSYKKCLEDCGVQKTYY